MQITQRIFEAGKQAHVLRLSPLLTTALSPPPRIPQPYIWVEKTTHPDCLLRPRIRQRAPQSTRTDQLLLMALLLICETGMSPVDVSETRVSGLQSEGREGLLHQDGQENRVFRGRVTPC